MSKFKSKQDVRNYVWRRIASICRSNPYRRIPNFLNAEIACEKVKKLEEYVNSKCVFSAPDSVLLRLREIALKDKKLLLVAKPKIKGFWILDKYVNPTIKAMDKFGRDVRLDELDVKVDLFVQGCVAVDEKGNRIGKGSGFGDREYELLKDYGLLSKNCLYIVVAHDMQVFDDLSYLMSEHDVRADVILTPSRIIRTKTFL